MRRVFIFFIILVSVFCADQAFASMPVAHLASLDRVFPSSCIAFTNTFFQDIHLFLKGDLFDGSLFFFISLLLYTFLILFVRLKRVWLSVAAGGCFCLLAMSAFLVHSPSIYVGIFLLLSLFLLILDLAFFGAKGWMTWVALLPMSWSWWIWLCGGDIAHKIDYSLLSALFEKRALLLLAAWILSLVFSQAHSKMFKSLYFLISKKGFKTNHQSASFKIEKDVGQTALKQEGIL